MSVQTLRLVTVTYVISNQYIDVDSNEWMSAIESDIHHQTMSTEHFFISFKYHHTVWRYIFSCICVNRMFRNHLLREFTINSIYSLLPTLCSSCIVLHPCNDIVTSSDSKLKCFCSPLFVHFFSEK